MNNKKIKIEMIKQIEMSNKLLLTCNKKMDKLLKSKIISEKEVLIRLNIIKKLILKVAILTSKLGREIEISIPL